MNVEWEAMSPAERSRFEEDLPWYVNGTLAEEERRWVDAVMARSVRAAGLLAQERAFAASAECLLATAPDEVGLAQLRTRLQDERAAGQAPAPVAEPAPRQTQARPRRPGGLFRTLADWFDTLAQAPLTGALTALVAVQFVVIGWFAGNRPPTEPTFRTVPVVEVRTLRVRFAEGVSERQIRDGLLAAGARIVGGPNQLGEYWLASDVVSLAEVQAALEQRSLVQSAEEDKRGPR